MEVMAIARYMRITPRKARLVAATVIGMPVKDALTVLEFTPKAAAKEVGKVVKSAAANATNNFNQDEDTLVVKRIVVNEGPTLKRGQARARGMFFSIFKRTSHITAIVESVEAPARGRRRAGAAAAARPAARKVDTTKAAAPKAAAKKAASSTVVEAAASKAIAEEAIAEATEVATGEAPAAEVPEVQVSEPAIEASVTEIAETTAAEPAVVEADVAEPAIEPAAEVVVEPEPVVVPEPTAEELAAIEARRAMTPHERALHDLREGQPEQAAAAAPEPATDAETKTEEDKA